MRADLWECEALGSITIPFGSWWKEKRFDCSLQIKIQRSLLGQKTTFLLSFSFLFCCYLSLPDWSALHSPSVWAAQKRLLRQRIGGGRKEKWKRPLDWRHGVWEEEAQWQEQCCFGLWSLRQIRRSCGRSETLSLEAAVVNTLAWFRS